MKNSDTKGLFFKLLLARALTRGRVSDYQASKETDCSYERGKVASKYVIERVYLRQLFFKLSFVDIRLMMYGLVFTRRLSRGVAAVGRDWCLGNDDAEKAALPTFPRRDIGMNMGWVWAMVL